MLNPRPFSPLVNTTSSVDFSHIAVVLSGSNDFDIRLLCSVKVLAWIDFWVSSFLSLELVSAYLKYKSLGTLMSFWIEPDADNLPVMIGLFSSDGTADIPEVFEVLVDKMEEQGTDVKTFESWDRLITLWFPAIWSAEAEFFKVLFSLSNINSSPFSFASDAIATEEALFVIEHDTDNEWLKVLHDKETSDLAFNKRSVSF